MTRQDLDDMVADPRYGVDKASQEVLNRSLCSSLGKPKPSHQ